MITPGNSRLNGFSGKIFLVGFMGSGKTHWGRIWAQEYAINFVDLDEVIEEATGKTIAATFEDLGEEHFREIEASALRSCAQLVDSIIACGGGTPCFFDNMHWMNEQGVTIYLKSQPQQILERVSGEEEKRPLFKRLNSAELLSFIEQKLLERNNFYQQAKYTVDSASLSADSLASILTQKDNQPDA